ncbi:creatininase family protein [Halorussus gelatinilyticus]|uniref:Creatininase family protein n=1 Tax=Halorussus gelatinilyticus TaxID=2937524 RepID=A0A8U0IG30_9EURY|nr:creatininase family protein [Halorussus gelatinilyticus]UPV99171.1 creatininase family protein [Halorussus gelatinilyticus]
MSRTYLYEHTTTTAAEAFEDATVAVLPTGSVEQHGPALPLGTDLLSARAVAETVADHPETVLLPPIPVGVSAHHRQFDGTLWTDPEIFERYVADVVASVAFHGVKKAVLVNGHGGNSGALRRAARTVRDEEVAFAAPWNWWSNLDALIEEELDTSLGHADAVETSMMLAIAEDLVRESDLEAAEENGGDSWGESVRGASVGFDAIDFTESGAVGEPTAGSREVGETLLDHASDDLAALVEWLAGQEMDDLWPREHK